MFLEAVVLGLFIGGFKGGRLANIIDMNIRGWYLIILSLFLSMSPIFLRNFDNITNTSVILMFFSMVILLIVLILNLDKKGVWLVLIGGLFNVAIMAFNAFKMPVMMSGLESAGITSLIEGVTDGTIINYVASEVTGVMQIFTKFIIVPKPYPFPKILTIGDILMSFGLLWMIVGEMMRPSYSGRGKMVQFSYGSAIKRR
ncbi:MAG: DUF5317 family protein [Clostridiales bacterium]|nr:DUF5317 family protein [Clostridiales bacterium]